MGRGAAEAGRRRGAGRLSPRPAPAPTPSPASPYPRQDPGMSPRGYQDSLRMASGRIEER